MIEETYYLNNVVTLEPKPMHVNEKIVDALANLTYKQRREGYFLARDTSTHGYDGDEPPKYPNVPIKDFVFWLFNYYNYHLKYTFTNPADAVTEFGPLITSSKQGRELRETYAKATAERKGTIEDLKSKVRKYFTIEESIRKSVIKSDYHFDCAGEATLEFEVSLSKLKDISFNQELAMIEYNNLKKF